jgi:tetratricopeptide (TPR) repeat protein
MKIFFLIALIIVGFFSYLEYNPSYKLSIEARYYYVIGDYEFAYDLSNQALIIREYNTMAFHIKNRSGLTLKMINFNQEAEEFFNKIKTLIQQKPLKKPNKVRIKMMSEIILSKYENLSFPLVEDDEVKDEAKKYFKEFKIIHNKILTLLGDQKDGN